MTNNKDNLIILNENKIIKGRKEKKEIKLPLYLTKNEIELLISGIKNIKHKLIIALGYGSGLTVSEIINIKVSDIDLENMKISINNKNIYRKVPISTKLTNLLKKYTQNKNKDELLIKSTQGGQLTQRSLQIIFSKNRDKLGLNKNYTFQSLRHSFAIHLLEKGIKIKDLKYLLGHKNIQNTYIYKKVLKNNQISIDSPF